MSDHNKDTVNKDAVNEASLFSRGGDDTVMAAGCVVVYKKLGDVDAQSVNAVYPPKTNLSAEMSMLSSAVVFFHPSSVLTQL